MVYEASSPIFSRYDDASMLDRDDFTSKVRVLEVDDRAVRCVEMRPREQGHHEQKTVLLTPGFLCGLSNMALLGHELTRYGFEVIPLAHTKPGKDSADDVRGVIEAFYAGKIGTPSNRLVLFAHSLGAINTKQCLTRYPELMDGIDGVVELAPAGYGGVTPSGALASVLSELSHRPDTQVARDAVKDAIRYTRASGWQIIGRAIEAKTINMVAATREIMVNNVPVSALVARNDKVIRRNGLTRGLGAAAVPYTYVSTAHAGHNPHLMFAEQTAQDVVAHILSLDMRNSAALGEKQVY
ncbi:MAG TPA: alpha/beta hydrolase [Candidatus Saccharimonas sp.]|nr:alpha/beta hydrolase [Candidatus Saccharimonas sp.]